MQGVMAMKRFLEDHSGAHTSEEIPEGDKKTAVAHGRLKMILIVQTSRVFAQATAIVSLVR